MEKFTQEDIDWYRDSDYGTYNKLIVKDPTNINIKLPGKIFSRLIINSRPEYKGYLPYEVHLKDLNKVDNEWTVNSAYLGTQHENGILDLYLRPERKYEVVELLWILLHEFRHKIQFNNKNIESCTWVNSNILDWFNEYKDINLMKHVLHEILPQEIDANTFACELMSIRYPGSKFDITQERLRRLKESQ